MARDYSTYLSKPWQVARAKFLRLHPWCMVCAQIGLRTRATEVDHVKAERMGGATWHPGNYQALCRQHHSAKTAHGPEHGSFVSHRPFYVIGPDGYELPAGVQPPTDESED